MRVYPGADAECFPGENRNVTFNLVRRGHKKLFSSTVAGMPAPQGYNMDGDSTGDGSYDTHFVRNIDFKLKKKQSIFIATFISVFLPHSGFKSN